MNHASTTATSIGSNNNKTSKIDRTLAGIVYLLQILAFTTAGVTLVIAAAIDYWRRPQVRGTWLESHFNWQLKTSLYSLAVAIIGAVTWQIGIGNVLLIGAALWLVYRVVRGWIRFTHDEPMTKEDEF